MVITNKISKREKEMGRESKLFSTKSIRYKEGRNGGNEGQDL